MSRSCDITGKKHQTGHNVSHSNICLLYTSDAADE